MFDVRAGAKVWSRTPPPGGGSAVVKLSVLSKATHPEGAVRTKREVGIREAVARGYKFKPLQVTIRKDGRLEVHDGNNRLAVARERGEKFVRVRFSRGVD